MPSALVDYPAQVRSSSTTSRSGCQDPVGQQPASGAEGHRPAGIAKAASAKDHAGFGGIHPEDRQDASDRAGQQGRGVAELLVDLLGDQDLVGGSRAPCRGRIPAQHLGTIALANALHQGLPDGKLLGRGCWRLNRHGRRLAHASSLSTVHPGQQWTPHNCLGRGAPQTPHLPQKVFWLYLGVLRRARTSLLITTVTSARTSTATIIFGTRLSGCCRSVCHRRPSARLRPVGGTVMSQSTDDLTARSFEPSAATTNDGSGSPFSSRR